MRIRLNIFSMLLTTLCMALLMSCGAKQTKATMAKVTKVEDKYETCVYADSSQRVHIDVNITLPVASDSVYALIRDSLLGTMEREFCYMIGDTKVIEPYKGKDKSIKAIVDYYGAHSFLYLNKCAEDDYKQRAEYIKTDTTLTEAMRRQIMQDTPQWEYESKISKAFETPKYIVFLHQTYEYLGGAHGGVGGLWYMTFNRSNGKKVTNFFVKEATEKMQGLLKKGLKEYFCESGAPIKTDKELMEQLQIDGNVIPLPVQEPYPSAAGLIFTYNQYEIACYAAGMPSFTIPYEQAMPYLTDEVKELLKK